MIEAAKNALRRRAPDGCGGIEAAHVGAILKDDSGTEKADAGRNIRSHAAAQIVLKQHPCHHECRGSGGDESIRSRASHALSLLPFQSYGCAQKQGGKELESKMENEYFYKIALQKSIWPRTEKTQTGPRSRL